MQTITADLRDSLPLTFLGLPHGGLEMEPIILEADSCLHKFRHVHFERVIPGAKFVDVTLIAKEHSQPELSYQRISVVREFQQIKQWFEAIGIGVSTGPDSINWRNVIAAANADDLFYSTQTESGEPKAAGWAFLQAAPPAEKCESFQIEAILQERDSQKKKEYLVKWHGYPDSQNTWEQEHDLIADGYSDSIQQWRTNSKDGHTRSCL